MKSNIKRAQHYLNQNPPAPENAIKVLQPLMSRLNAPWPVFHLMGVALLQEEQYETAAEILKKALEKGGEEPETYHLLSVSYYKSGQLEDAERLGREALNRRPDFFKAWLNLGAVHRAQANLEEALKCYQKANQLDPRSAGVAFRIGAIYRDQGNLRKAKELFEITLKIDPGYYEAQLEIADIYRKQQKFRQAEECLETAAEELDDAKRLPVQVSLGVLYKEQGRYEEAIQVYKEILAEYPEEGGVRVNYAVCLQELGRFDESEKQYQKVLDEQPDSHEALSNYLMGLHYNPNRNKDEIYEAHLQWDELIAPEERKKRPVPKNKSKSKKLRVGFLSGGFRRHPVGWMITEALEHLPKEQFEVYCYSSNNIFDTITRRIQTSSNVWRSVVGYDDEVTAKLIRKDEIDILVELSGHAADNCLKTVDLEPAPVIVKWVGGLFNTTGLQSVDYLISDWYETPAGEENYYTEKLARLPDDYVTFMPPEYAPAVGPLPAKQNGYITFGCFNNPTKVNEELLERWAKIMQRVPESRLLLKSKQYGTSTLTRRIIEQLGSYGIDEERITFKGQTSHVEHLECYNSVDIALDTWPYSGGLTTCEALWMGVPVVTLPGPTFAGRHSTTHLFNAGFPGWIAKDWEDYLNTAVSLAGGIEKLSELRDSLRSTMAESPICDGKRFAAHLGKAFRKIWHKRVEGYETGAEKWQDHIEVKALPKDSIKTGSTGSAGLATVFDSSFIVDDTSPDISKHVSKDNNGPKTSKDWKNSNKRPIPSGADSSKGISETFHIETNDGITVCTPADLNLLTPYVLLEQEQWYEPELNFVREYLKPGMKAMDIGAAFGAYALLMARQVGRRGKVFAFEPGKVAGKYLKMSKAENELDQLEVIPRAVSDSPGKAFILQADTPELNSIDENGTEEVIQVALDDWWKYQGQPDIDFLKLDVNGMETLALKGGYELLKSSRPIMMISTGKGTKHLQALREQLYNMDFQLFEFIPGPKILSKHDPQAGVDPYLMNLIAIDKSRVEEFEKSGWIFNEKVKAEVPDQELWQKTLGDLAWTKTLMPSWKEKLASGEYGEYLKALNLICAAEQIQVNNNNDLEARSRRASMMLKAAQILISLFNNGKGNVPAAMTFARVMFQLGKREQSLEMVKELMETYARNEQFDMPFLPPLESQDEALVKTDITRWVTVRIVETWIIMKEKSTYTIGGKEEEMLKALNGNPEILSDIETRINLLNRDDDSFFTEKLKLSSKNRSETASEIKQRENQDFQTALNLIAANAPSEVKKHPLPGNLIVSLTSFPKRFEDLPLTLMSLTKQSIKPDLIVLWIAYKNKKDLTPEIKYFEKLGVQINFCEDLKSYKKLIPALEKHPESYIVTADDDLYYKSNWLEGLVNSWNQDDENIIAYRVHRIKINGKGKLMPYKHWGWQYRENLAPSSLNFPTCGAGALFPPNSLHKEVINRDKFTKLAPSADDVWLYWMARLKGSKIQIARMIHPLVEWPSSKKEALWKKNILGGLNDQQIQSMIQEYGFIG